MGIDPNNHKPQRSFPLPRANNVSSAANIPSSGSMNEDPPRVPLIKSFSETPSYLVEEKAMVSSSSFPLNLDLTIAFPSSPREALVEEKNKHDSEFTRTGNNDDTTPTLLLFP